MSPRGHVKGAAGPKGQTRSGCPPCRNPAAGAARHLRSISCPSWFPSAQFRWIGCAGISIEKHTNCGSLILSTISPPCARTPVKRSAFLRSWRHRRRWPVCRRACLRGFSGRRRVLSLWDINPTRKHRGGADRGSNRNNESCRRPDPKQRPPAPVGRTVQQAKPDQGGTGTVRAD